MEYIDSPTQSSNQPPASNEASMKTAVQEKRKSTASKRLSTASNSSSLRRPFAQTFFSPRFTDGRRTYLKILVGGCFAIVIAIFAVFSIYWGALWKTPERNLDGWIIDFDGALIGRNLTAALTASSVKVTWIPVPASQFPGGPDQVAAAVLDQKTWVALVVHENATRRLNSSYVTPDPNYSGASLITVYATEARNENAYRSLISPSVQGQLSAFTTQFTKQALGPLLSQSGLSAATITSILAISPQTVLAPVGYEIKNLLPFDQPVATAVTFVGLIYQLILSFFVVMTGYSARDMAGLNRRLTLGSLIKVRFVSAFGAYFFISLFYALLSLAFKLDFTREFGKAGFVVFWMLNWIGMLSVGLALEAIITLLTTRFIPFFMILWIITNVSVCIFPIEVLPIVYRYGYAVPFYNVSRAVRCIVFGTKNTVGLNFGVLIAWTAISCLSLPLIQWFVRRQDVRAAELESRTVGSDPGVLDLAPEPETIELSLSRRPLGVTMNDSPLMTMEDSPVLELQRVSWPDESVAYVAK